MLQEGFILPAEKLQRVWEGLVKAVLWHLTDCSARYAPRFREGIYAISLVRSLAAAGERIEDYVRHVRHVIRAFTDGRFSGPGTGDSGLGVGESGFGECRLSVDDFRLRDSEFDVRDSVFAQGLDVPGSQRESEGPNPGLNDSELKNSEVDNRQSSIENRQSPGPEPPAPKPRDPQSLLFTLSSSLAQVSWRRLRAWRQHSAWERRSVERLFRRLAQEREHGQIATSERLTLLAEDLHRVLFSASRNFQTRARRLSHRFEALAARLLHELGLPPMDLHVRPSPAVEAATAASLPEALGNPIIPPRQVRARSKPRRPRVKRPEKWEHRRGVWSPDTQSWQSFDDLEGLSRVEALSSESPSPESVSPGLGSSDSRRDSDAARPRANTESRTRNSAAGNRQSSIENRQSDDRQLFAVLVARALGPNPSLKKGGTDAAPAGLADALWTRLESGRLQAEEERQTFAALLDDYVTSLQTCRSRSWKSFSPESGVETSAGSGLIDSGLNLTALATGLVLLLRGQDADPRITAKGRIDAEILRFRTQIWIYLLLVTRGVAHSEIAWLRPDAPSDCGGVQRFLKLRHARDPRRRGLAEFYLNQEERRLTVWKRWQPVIESGDIGRLLSEEEAGPDRGAWDLVRQIAGI